MCTCITLCCSRELYNTALIGPVTVGGRELCVLVLHYAGPDSYLTLLRLATWHLQDGKFVYLYSILLDQTYI